MPLPLQTPRPAEQLTKEFAIKGGLRMLIDEVIIPTRAILDRPRKFAMATGVVGAGGANLRTELALTNNFSSELNDDGIVLVHKLWLGATELINVNVSWPTVAVSGLTLITTARFTDNQRTGLPISPFGSKNDAVPTAATNFLRIEVPATSESVRVDFDPHPIIIRPQAPRSLLIRPGEDDQALRCSILWSEPADPA